MAKEHNCRGKEGYWPL